ncbi:MAG: leucine-rich repeat protein, partial [Prevotella sp.]|nr:leucine-rich repeat protein [Prevotella sp.]
AKWGSLTWNLDGDGKFTITGTGAMDAASDNSDYDWYNYSSYFTSITIGEGITTVAAKAFGGDNNTNPYGGVTTVDLPSTLTTIGENAFAYCTGATFNADNLIAQGVTIGDNAFNQVGCIVGTLTNNGDNTTMLSLMANAATAEVTIKGRTLYKDGNWNTICLPFDVKSDNSLLTDATVKELDLYGYYSEEGVYYSYAAANLRRTGFDAENGTLYLYFKDATADSDDNLLKAGTPYLMKWPSGGTDITGDLTFEGVKVISSPQTLTSEDGQVGFRGTYASTTFNAENKSILLLGEANALYWPQSGASIGACRAYFEMNGGANAVRSFVLNFNGDATGVRLIDNGKLKIENEAGAWYTLDGRKLDGKPTVKGVYIHGGRAVVVK